MNATTDNRTAADLEREGDEIRADLDRTLDEIERKLSPGELLDRSMEFLRDNGSDFLREAGETVRRNPIPVLLTAAGLVWLTTAVAGSRASSRRSREDDEEGDFSEFRDGSGEDYEAYSQRYSARSYSTGNGGRRHNGGSNGRDAQGRVRNAAHKVKGKLSESMHAVQERTEGARSNLMNLVQEQPIALGALALAAGALLGAALPITPYENRLIGPVHDRTMARAKEVGEREYENIKQAVTSSTSAGREGRSAETRENLSGRSTEQPEQG